VTIGTHLRLVGVPDGLEDYPDFPMKSTFERCVGHEFVIAGFNELGMAELEIESVTGSVGETIWVEPRFLQVVSKWPFQSFFSVPPCLCDEIITRCSKSD
jgi:hypothetical protein